MFTEIPTPFDDLPDVVKWAHTLSTETTLSFAEALSELTPLWESTMQQTIRSLTTQLEELQTESNEMEQLIGRQHQRIEALEARRDQR